MGIRMKFDDVLTLLSLKSPEEVLRLTLKGKKGVGYLLYRDGEVKWIKYGHAEGDEALDALLREREIELMDLREVISAPAMNLLSSFITQHLSNIDEVKGFVLLDDHGEPYIEDLPEPSEKNLQLIKTEVLPYLTRGASLTARMIEKEVENGLIFVGVKLKPELNAVVAVGSRTSIDKIKIFFKNIAKITG